MMQYSFDVDIAKKYGLGAAIIISNFQFWIFKNKTNGRHFYEGRTWTYNSITAFQEQFPFWTEKQIRTILQKLRDEGILITGNFNKAGYDRTLWYAFKDESIFLAGQMETPKRAKRIAHKGEPIPDSLPDSKPDIDPIRELRKKIEEYFKKVNPDYYHDEKQVGARENIIKKAHGDEKLIFDIFMRHKKLIDKGEDKFFKNDPHTPLVILGKWDYIKAYKFDMPKGSWERD